MWLRKLFITLVVCALVACSTTAEPPVSEPEGAAEATIPPAVAEAATSEAVEVEATGADGLTSGRTAEGVFFLGAEDAPVTLIDYSDFLWTTCRAYVLGTEPQIVEDYVAAGEVRLIFWPLLDLGQGSERAAVAAECAGQQDPALFWQMHTLLFERQAEVYRAERDYFVNAAREIGVEQTTFEACYDDSETLAAIEALDRLRRDRGIVGRPTFDINGEIFSGLPPYEQFQAVIDASLGR